MLCEEVRQGYSLLGAEPYQVLWSDWSSKASNLIMVTTACEEARKQYSAVRDTQGADAAAELGKQFVQRNREVRVERQRLAGEPEKVDDAFKKLFENEQTAIEVFIQKYAEQHPDEFFITG